MARANSDLSITVPGGYAMTSSNRPPFVLRPHDYPGTWESNDRRYFEYAHELLQDLELLCVEVKEKWPIDLTESLDQRSRVEHPEVWLLARRRDRTSDTVRIFAAMAVEGFMNWYGVFRLGQSAFDQHFERLGVVAKLRTILLVCDAIDVAKSDALVMCAIAIAESRNALVHPKAREVSSRFTTKGRTATAIPDAARHSVDQMTKFFEEFALAVPAVTPHIPSRRGDII